MCLVGFPGAQRDRAEHHHGEETCPPAEGHHRGHRPTLRQRPTDRREAVVPPPDLRDPADRLWTHRYTGRTF